MTDMDVGFAKLMGLRLGKFTADGGSAELTVQPELWQPWGGFSMVVCTARLSRLLRVSRRTSGLLHMAAVPAWGSPTTPTSFTRCHPGLCVRLPARSIGDGGNSFGWSTSSTTRNAVLPKAMCVYRISPPSHRFSVLARPQVQSVRSWTKGSRPSATSLTEGRCCRGRVGDVRLCLHQGAHRITPTSSGSTTLRPHLWWS